MSSPALVIDRLTDEHRESFEVWRERWTAIGRSTEEIDYPRAVDGVASAYAAANLPPPFVLFAASPMSGLFAIDCLHHGVGAGVWDGVGAGVRDGVWDGVGAGVGAGVWDGVGDGVRDGVWDGVGAGVRDGVRDGVGAGVRAGVRAGVGAGVRDGVGDGVRDGVGAGVGDGVGDGVRDGVRDGVGDGVRDGVGAGVGDGVGDGVRDGVRAGVGDGVRDGVGDGVWDGVRAGVGSWLPPSAWWQQVFYGCHEAGMLSFYDWFAHHGLPDVCAPLAGLTQLGRSAGWVFLYRHVAVVTDRPVVLHDELASGGSSPHRRRLHNSAGPTVVFADGWSLWHWHGLLVPQWVVESPTINAINREQNTELRRCAIESFGWDRYLEALDAAPVDTADDPGNPGRSLRLFDVPDGLFEGEVRLLVMENASRDRDGSRRVFAETVPADCDTAVGAAAWQFDVSTADYGRVARAT